MGIMGTLGFKLIGARLLERKLNKLPAKVGKTVVRKALRQGAKPVQAAAKANAASLVGGTIGSQIAKSIGTRAKSAKWRRKYGAYGIFVGVDPSNKHEHDFVYFTGGSAFSTKTRKQVVGRRHYIPNAIEYGHAFPGRGGGKNPPKDVAAVGYMRKAYHSQGSGATQIVIREMKVGVERAAQES
ncbi:MAG TPA: HK97 gp10 family phage protein [Sedimentisphaerales bacterium]|nr:HK97 gp10 family phage protein [Sedimentisphaerales bacterium]